MARNLLLELLHWTLTSSLNFTHTITQGSLHLTDEGVRLIDGIFGTTSTSIILAEFFGIVRREIFPDLILFALKLPLVIKNATEYAYLQQSVRRQISLNGGAAMLFQVAMDPHSKLIEAMEKPLSRQAVQELLRSCLDSRASSRYDDVESSFESTTESTNEQSNRDSTTASSTTNMAEPIINLHWEVQPSGSYHTSHNHMLQNLDHYVPYSSASYGRYFMMLFGVGQYPVPPERPMDKLGVIHDPSHVVFSQHTKVPLECIVYSSFHAHTKRRESASPFTTESSEYEHLPEFIVSLNHSHRHVVVTIRGTLAFIDLATDLEFVPLAVDIEGRRVGKVHCGMWKQTCIHASPQSPLHRVVTKTLLDHPSYELVLVGHSMGAGIASLLALQWCNLTNAEVGEFRTSLSSGLPPGRPIHAYLYGPPCTMSIELCRAVRGLMTSVVHEDDFVSCLSFGSVCDLRDIGKHLPEMVGGGSVAITGGFGCDLAEQDAQTSRRSSLAAYDSAVGVSHNEQSLQKPDEALAQSLLLSPPEIQSKWQAYLRVKSQLKNEKLYVPGDVYWMHRETVHLPKVNNSQSWQERRIIKMSYIEHVERMFDGFFISPSMVMDHSCDRYEFCLHALMKGSQVV